MIVIKVGGELVKSGAIAEIAPDVAELSRGGEKIVIVHGGGPQATELQKQLGQTPNIVAGRRITDAATLDVMKMIVAGLVNVDLCSALTKAGCKAVGLHGASSGAIRAKKRPPKVMAGAGPDPIDFGLVGDVTGVNKDLLTLLIEHGHVPVLACLGCDVETGQTYNINADTVANQVAVALDAKALVVVSDVPGVLKDVADPSSRIGKMTKAEADDAIAKGVVTKGMIPKLEESFAAIASGVRSVLIVGKLSRGELVARGSRAGQRGNDFVLNVVVADTGLGNVRSVVRAIEKASSRAKVSITNDPEAIARADALVVPGQGAFRDCATALSRGGLGDAIRASITKGTSYLGICLGMQALFATSEEAPGCAGLAIFPGTVVKLRGGSGLKIPHVGWNTVEPARKSWVLPQNEYFYFVHSYVVAPEDATLACGKTTHGETFVSAIEKDNVAAVQFHPEKSQRAGLALLERFLSRC